MWIKFFGHRICAKRGCLFVVGARESGTKVRQVLVLASLTAFIVGMTGILKRCEAVTVFLFRQLLRLIVGFIFCSKDETCNDVYLGGAAWAFLVLMNEMVLFRSFASPKSFLSKSNRSSFSYPTELILAEGFASISTLLTTFCLDEAILMSLS